MLKFTVFIALVYVLTGCGPKAPQLPSNKVDDVDTLALTLLKVNELLAIETDSLLGIYVALHHSGYKKHNLGFWYDFRIDNNSQMLFDKDICTVEYTMYSLKDSLQFVKSDKISFEIGKKQTVTGLEEGVKLMGRKNAGWLVVPWYLAYGVKGDGSEVEPYTSVVFEVKSVN